MFKSRGRGNQGLQPDVNAVQYGSELEYLTDCWGEGAELSQVFLDMNWENVAPEEGCRSRPGLR